MRSHFISFIVLLLSPSVGAISPDECAREAMGEASAQIARNIFEITETETTLKIKESADIYLDAAIEEHGTLFFTLYTEKYDRTRENLRGKPAFDYMMYHFGNKVERIAGNWVSGTNLEQFNAGLKRGLSKEEAAKQTWTGQQAARYGFTETRFTKGDCEDIAKHKHCDIVLVYFEKPGNRLPEHLFPSGL